ncbi:MAG: hypothetical protein AUK47_05720 [Deltaproteobacteria bacterium CG2_30_63_29]|nr:MAG: hypothetical protein AUK47_05720 [Deltaproteobacteria bacterium CG2_30_63_29]
MCAIVVPRASTAVADNGMVRLRFAGLSKSRERAEGSAGGILTSNPASRPTKPKSHVRAMVGP